MAKYQHALAMSDAKVDGAVLMVSGGFVQRHYLGSIEYCDQSVSIAKQGDKITGVQVIWHEESCIWVSYYWDEWVPGEDDYTDEIPGGTGDGGPYFSPEDTLHRAPTIDTLPELDHDCDHYDLVEKHINFKCVDLLSTADSARLYDSLDVYLKPLNSIADSLTRAECDSAISWLNGARAYGLEVGYPILWRGITDSVAPPARQHDGSGGVGSPDDPATAHLDPKILDKASSVLGKKGMLQAALHEIAHAYGGATHDSLATPPYAGVPFFRSINSTSGAFGSCIL